MKNKVFKFLGSLRYTHFIFLTLAGVINAVGVTLLLAPAGMYDGGFSGTSILLSQVTPLSMSVFLLLLNVPFFLFGLKKLGGAFIVYSLYTVAVYSLFSYLFQNSFGIDFSDGSPIAGTDLLLCSVYTLRHRGHCHQRLGRSALFRHRVHGRS